MQGTLKDVHFEPLVSNPNLSRWRNTAQWARNTLKEEGLLKNNSPRGVWEIAEAGIEFLHNENNQPDMDNFV